ncbi:MAG: Jag N-terminal domain-containing protein [Acidobacteria bacterium]|nr:Jag N-terminal domain-containing protein [Acidobacteriota bacterium]MBV9475833.1 Jag N-terminal domain-containing protein [Acidobacteriota bacterium]
MSQRFEGHNLEEALTHASQTLGVERWQLTYHVLLEKRGFLGGVKRVVIEAEINREAAAPATPQPAPPAEVAPHRAPAESRSGRADGGGGGRSRGGRSGRDRGPRSDDRGGERRGGRGRRGGGGGGNRDELRTGDFEQFFAEVPEQGPESDAARVVREWCESVIFLARLDLVVRTEEKDEQIILRLFGADARRLTEQHGELLDAIQVLANKALTGRKVEKEIEFDCEAFKDKRVEELGARAREVADRVRRGGREELLPAMTPIERRIVHLALQDDQDVTTESRGDGFYKRVAIVMRPAGEPRANDADAQPAPEA